MSTRLILNSFAFLSTLSLRRATPCGASGGWRQGLFLSTLSLRRATGPVEKGQVYYIISIHALLAESDADMSAAWNRFTHFYPRSPCGERLR